MLYDHYIVQMFTIKECGHMLYYINRSMRQVIQYNLLSKKKHIYYQTSQNIYNYHIFGDHRVFIFIRDYYGRVVDWNNKWFKIKKPICYEYFLHVSRCLYFIVSTFNKFYIYNQYGKIMTLVATDIALHVSSDGNFVLVLIEGTLYLAEAQNFMNHILQYPNHKIYNSDVYDIVKDVSNIKHKIDLPTSYWHTINNSIKIVGFYTYPSCIINIVSNAKMEIYNPFCIDIGDFLIVLNRNPKIYNANNFELIQKIKCGLDFIAYHSGSKLFISQDLQTYRFDNMSFVKIQLGKNYLVDSTVIPNFVMNIILCDDMLFDLLPYEVVCIELYGQIINYIVLKN